MPWGLRLEGLLAIVGEGLSVAPGARIEVALEPLPWLAWTLGTSVSIAEHTATRYHLTALRGALSTLLLWQLSFDSWQLRAGLGGHVGFVNWRATLATDTPGQTFDANAAWASLLWRAEVRWRSGSLLINATIDPEWVFAPTHALVSDEARATIGGFGVTMSLGIGWRFGD